MKAYTDAVVAQAINSLPMNIITSPIPLTTANLIGLDQAISNPYLAEAQKLSPLRAIRI